MNGERKLLYFRIGNCNKIKCGCVLRRHGTTVIFFFIFSKQRLYIRTILLWNAHNEHWKYLWCRQQYVYRWEIMFFYRVVGHEIKRQKSGQTNVVTTCMEQKNLIFTDMIIILKTHIFITLIWLYTTREHYIILRYRVEEK